MEHRSSSSKNYAQSADSIQAGQFLKKGRTSMPLNKFHQAAARLVMLSNVSDADITLHIFMLFARFLKECH